MISVDGIFVCVVAEYIGGMIVSFLSTASADIKCLIACGACYADSGFGVDIDEDIEDTLGGGVFAEECI